MTLYEKKRHDNDSFRALTGLNVDEFDILLPFFDNAWHKCMEESTINQTFRWVRRYTSYKNSPLPTSADKLFFILVYIKTHALQAVHGALFGMAQSAANRWIHATMPALFRALSIQGFVPATNADELRAYFADHPDQFFFIHDGTERSIERPVAPGEETFFFSGKAHDHTVNHLILINIQKQVIFCSHAYEGATHDKTIADNEQYTLPDRSTLTQDKGFQGFIIAGVRIWQPKKKPPNGELADTEKAENRRIAKIRIAIEHVIACIKRFRVLKDRYRLKAQYCLNMVMNLGCGLHNFIVQQRKWKPIEY